MASGQKQSGAVILIVAILAVLFIADAGLVLGEQAERDFEADAVELEALLESNPEILERAVKNNPAFARAIEEALEPEWLEDVVISQYPGAIGKACEDKLSKCVKLQDTQQAYISALEDRVRNLESELAACHAGRESRLE